MLHSHYRALCAVVLPFQSRQKYMHSFDLSKPVMADGYEDYLEPVMALCESAGATNGMAHMTVDEKIVYPGQSQRRPRPHVDGCYQPAKTGWTHPMPGQWAHGIRRMPIIVAASVTGCKVWDGVFDGEPKDDGDLTHIADQLGDGEVVPPNMGYLLSPDCVHESMIFDRTVERTFLRIALPVEFEFTSK